MNSSWQRDQLKFIEEVVPRLKALGPKIKTASDNGDELADNIMYHYHILYKSYDPITTDLLRKELDQWEKIQ